MATYKLSFFATGKQLFYHVTSDVIYGKSSYSYKRLVDDEISKWLSINKLNGKSTKILNIILQNNSEQKMFIQENWSDYSTIVHIDFDEETNSELIGIKKDKYFC
jgi:hypothetical protein